VSIVEYGLTVAHSDGTFTTAHPVHHGQLPNGHSTMEDPDTRKRTAIAAHLDFLITPVNLGARSSAVGWIAFFLSRPISRDAADHDPMLVFLVDQHRKTWKMTLQDGLGDSAPWPHQPELVITPARRGR
jgi:hypothetical protein